MAISHERRVLLLALLAGLPAVIATVGLLAWGGYSAKARFTLSLVVAVVWWGAALAVRRSVVHPLQTVANLLSAMREEDFSFRARVGGSGDALDEVLREVNALAATLKEQRLGAVEATALLRKVMDEIDVALFAFDPEGRLSLVNRAGERLLGRPGERLMALEAADLWLEPALQGPAPAVIELALPGGAGRFEVRRGHFRQHGRPHRLLVLADVSRALREEERQAWQRLIRVLGHELNNSLAPIRSVAGSLEGLLQRRDRPPDWEEDMRRGVAVIGARAEALSRFMDGYARLARLPPPQREAVVLGALVKRVARLEDRVPVALVPGPDLTVRADGAQLEQLLINLVRNAAEAAVETSGSVQVGWGRGHGPSAEIWIEDDGPGLPPSANLFVPFFTTKAQGSGIGLVLSRQIAEAHGGTLTLRNRDDGPGCRAELRLPLAEVR